MKSKKNTKTMKLADLIHSY